jgi:hypothetical protein
LQDLTGVINTKHLTKLDEIVSFDTRITEGGTDSVRVAVWGVVFLDQGVCLEHVVGKALGIVFVEAD